VNQKNNGDTAQRKELPHTAAHTFYAHTRYTPHARTIAHAHTRSHAHTAHYTPCPRPRACAHCTRRCALLVWTVGTTTYGSFGSSWTSSRFCVRCFATAGSTLPSFYPPLHRVLLHTSIAHHKASFTAHTAHSTSRHHTHAAGVTRSSPQHTTPYATLPRYSILPLLRTAASPLNDFNVCTSPVPYSQHTPSKQRLSWLAAWLPHCHTSVTWKPYLGSHPCSCAARCRPSPHHAQAAYQLATPPCPPTGMWQWLMGEHSLSAIRLNPSYVDATVSVNARR